MYLSKSKYCLGVQCPKILWLEKNKPEEKEEVNNERVLATGSSVGQLAKNLFGTHKNIEFSDNLNDMVEATKEALKKDKIIITEASFVFEKNFCSVDILKKIDNRYEIYEVKSSTKVKDIYIDDISYQNYILQCLGYNIKNSYIVYLNSDYIRKDSLDLKKLFIIKNVNSEISERIKNIDKKIKNISTIAETKEEPNIDINEYCQEPYLCPYFSYCKRHLPQNNIFDIRNMKSSQKFLLYKNGHYTFTDLLNQNIDEKFKQQIDFQLNNKETSINKIKIKDFLNTLTYPLYFLDFETYQQAIPEFDGVKPYMQIPFQYSLHYIEIEGDDLKHTDFLSEPGKDPRRKLAEKLVKDIKLDSCILAYNMMFEKMVIKNLADLYPDLHDHLMNIHTNMKDLMIPFKNRNYYNKDMQGSYSIKYVLPALFPNEPSLNYHNLEQIHNGSEAMSAFTNLINFEHEEQKIIRENLLKYCELDTFAMVKIWEKLKQSVK